MSDWQPIETAPKNGEAVLLYKPDELRSGSYIIAGYFGEWPEGQAIMTKYWIACCGYSLRQPTHWMPLPEPPK